MLLAGAAGSLRMVDEPGERVDLPLPSPLAGRGGVVTLRKGPVEHELERRVIVEARIDGVTRRQSLRYVRVRDAWALAGADLQVPPPSAGATTQ
jgi:hypothetical protein